MFDPAILLALQNIPMPPERPQAAIEQSWSSNAAAQLERRAKISVESYRNSVAHWAANVRKILAENEILLAAGNFDREALARGLSLVIGDLESHAEALAVSSARLEKKINRSVKNAFQIDPSSASVLRAFGHQLLATEKFAIDEMLEVALYMRATRAGISPKEKNSAIFENADDLESYLQAALA